MADGQLECRATGGQFAEDIDTCLSPSIWLVREDF